MELLLTYIPVTMGRVRLSPGLGLEKHPPMASRAAPCCSPHAAQDTSQGRGRWEGQRGRRHILAWQPSCSKRPGLRASFTTCMGEKRCVRSTAWGEGGCCSDCCKTQAAGDTMDNMRLRHQGHPSGVHRKIPSPFQSLKLQTPYDLSSDFIILSKALSLVIKSLST